MSDLQLLTPAEVASLCGITERTLKDWRIKGEGPPAVYLTARTVRYRETVVRDWLASHQPAFDGSERTND